MRKRHGVRCWGLQQVDVEIWGPEFSMEMEMEMQILFLICGCP